MGTFRQSGNREGKVHDERAAAFGDALGPDASAHETYQTLADSQTETDPSVLAAGRTVDLGETVKDSVELIGRDADAAVNDGEPNARGFGPGIRQGGPHGHMPLLRELERIANEIQ